MSSRYALLLAIGALTLSGCAPGRSWSENSAFDAYPTESDELDFWDDLATRSVVTNNDALYGLLLLADNASARESYQDRVAAAQSAGWLKSDDPPPANESARVGMISLAVCDILEITGGVTMLVFGPSTRYCTRELVYLEVIPPRSENQSLSGLEFVDLVSRVQAFRDPRAAVTDLTEAQDTLIDEPAADPAPDAQQPADAPPEDDQPADAAPVADNPDDAGEGGQFLPPD